MWRWALPVALALAVGAVSLDAGFVYDDPSALLENPVVNGEAPVSEAFVRDFWGRPASEGFTTWRPAMPVVWALLWKVFPENPLPFHLLSALLHALAVALSVELVRRLGATESVALAAGTLFALHPLNVEAVSAIVAQADLLSFSLVLAACIVALRPPGLRVGLSCAALLLVGSLVKESAIIFAPLVALLAIFRSNTNEDRWASLVPIGVVTAAVIAFQASLPRAPGIQMITSNLAHAAEGGTRVWLGLYNIGRSLAKAVWPWPMVPNHGYAAVELQSDVLAPYAVAGAGLLLFGIVAGVWAVRKRSLLGVTALSFLYAPALLQSHWFVALITDLAERLLYPATLGIAIIVASGLMSIKVPIVRAASVAALGLVLFVSSLSARRAWADEDSLWTYAVEKEPRAALHHHNVSNTFFRAGDVERGAYHRLVYVYLLDRFPERVHWSDLEALQSEPPLERFVELPAVVSESDPCPLVRTFMIEAKRYEPLHAFASTQWARRYPRCISAPGMPAL